MGSTSSTDAPRSSAATRYCDADRAGPEDDSLLGRGDPAAGDCPDSDRHRLDDRRADRILLTHRKRLLGGKREPLLKRTVAVNPDQREIDAHVAAADRARVALPARGVREQRDSLARPEVRWAIGPYLLDDPRRLVPLDAREALRLLDRADVAEEVVEVRAADADRFRPDEHLAGAGRARLPHVHDLHDLSRLGDCRAHQVVLTRSRPRRA